MYSEIKSVSSANENRIRAAKLKREELQGENYHQVQCESILETISDDHGIHTRPFTFTDQEIYINSSQM